MATIKEQLLELARLIREGSKIRPMARGAYFQPQGGQWCSCALGAAYEAHTGQDDIETSDSAPMVLIKMNFDDLARFPVHSLDYLELHRAIVNWNDSGDYTREQIADKLEALAGEY